MLLSTVLDNLYEKVQELGKRKSWFLFLAVVFAFVVFINGIGIVPEAAYQRLSQNPFTTRTDIHFNNYWQESLLLPLLAYYLGMTGTITFNILSFAIIAAGFGLFARYAIRHWGSMLALILTSLLITSPLTTIMLSWLGTPDGLTVLLTIPFLFTRSSILIFILAFLGAANHPAFIIAAFEILILRWVMRDTVSIRQLIFAVIGIIFGYAAVKFFLNTYGIDVVSRYEFMQLRDLGEWVSLNFENLPATLFSLFNIHWLIFPASMIMLFKKDRRFFLLVILMLFLNYVIVFFTLDTTRVFILTSWGILFTTVLHSCKLAIPESHLEAGYRSQYIRALLLIGMISFFTPRYFSWVGEIHMAPFSIMLGQLLK